MSDDIWTGETILTTDRLILRLFRRGDIPLHQAICVDPEARLRDGDATVYAITAEHWRSR
jgi:hypothetical protein